jgi:hypothetical protein
MQQRALVVRGGWEGHAPVEATERVLPFLREHFEVAVAESLDVYADAGALRGLSLVVQCWSEGQLTPAQEEGLLGAVRAGTGFAGWHGGVVATMRLSSAYDFMVGGRFVAHPGGFVDYRVEIAGDHEIVAGLGGFDVHTEQYYLHVDPSIDVLATTTFSGEHEPAARGAVMPVVWTRRYGEGRVFVTCLGHFPHELDAQPHRTLLERGLLWAARS